MLKYWLAGHLEFWFQASSKKMVRCAYVLIHGFFVVKYQRVHGVPVQPRVVTSASSRTSGQQKPSILLYRICRWLWFQLDKINILKKLICSKMIKKLGKQNENSCTACIKLFFTPLKFFWPAVRYVSSWKTLDTRSWILFESTRRLPCHSGLKSK